MDFETTVDIIIKDIEGITSIVDDFKNYPGVPLFQIELAKSKCKSVAEVLAILKEAPKSTAAVKPAPEPAPIPAPEPVPEPAPISAPKPAPKSEPKPVTETVTEPKPKPQSEPKPEPKPEPRVVTRVVTPSKPKVAPEEVSAVTKDLMDAFDGDDSFDESDDDSNITALRSKLTTVDDDHSIPKNPKSESSILADTFNPINNSINDKMGKPSMPERNKAKPTSDLFKSIGINDKFLFIREIFNNDEALYKSVITQLNNSNTYTEAVDIILGYVDDEEDEAYLMLLDLIRRKFNVYR